MAAVGHFEYEINPFCLVGLWLCGRHCVVSTS